MKQQFELNIIRPGGNDTALIKGLIPKSKKKIVNDLILNLYPNVEQVGFYKYFEKKNLVQLEMAGGEFCGNAIRALAYLLLNDNQGKIRVRSSGTKDILTAGVNKNNEVYTQIPVSTKITNIKYLGKNISFVPMEGIVYLITKKPIKIKQTDLKQYGNNLLQQYNLLYKYPCAGVIFYSQNREKIKIDPIVWIRDVKTLFYESACASGTAALGFWYSKIMNSSELNLSVQQPFGELLTVLVKKNTSRFTKCIIQGNATSILLKQNLFLEV